ncbi:MAG TPA: tetratricopeptide repeat protein, partial [Polyangia bacterium]
MARVIAAVVTLLCLSVQARAQGTSEDAVAKITQLNKDAVTAYQAKKYEDARKALKQALDLSDASGLEQHPITARTHIHMGIVIIGGFKQRDLGIKQFKKAIEIESTINLTKALVTPEMTEAFAEAKGGPAAPAAATTPPPAAPAAPAEPTEPPATESPPAATPAAPPPEVAPEAPASGLVHEPVTEGKKGSAISITVGVAADLKFDKIILAYRPEGATEFLGREMTEVAEGRYGAEIPTTATLGASVAYYVEADDTEGNPVGARGSVDSPLVINLGGGHASARHKSDDDEGEEEEDEGPDHQYFVALMGGSGFGWATGVGDTNHDVMINPAGIAPASLFQIAPEFGYWWTSSLMFSLQLRYQH